MADARFPPFRIVFLENETVFFPLLYYSVLLYHCILLEKYYRLLFREAF
jgi:hypothetical protein